MSAIELSLVVPVKNEQESIGPFVERVTKVLADCSDPAGKAYEILFVDDGSTDKTIEAIRSANASDPRIRGISLSRNFGKEAALSAGLDEARGDAIVPIDVDMQDPPEMIEAMLEEWRKGADVVNGVRGDRASDSFSKRVTAGLYYRTHNWLSHDKIPAHTGDFRLLDRKVVEVIRTMPERNRFMKGMFSWAGFRQSSVVYERDSRTDGDSKFGFWKLWTLALDGITSSSTVPLRVWSYVGGLVALASMAYAAIVVIRTLIYGVEVPGYASLMVAVLFLGGLQLLSLGILGEYVGRILIETKARPLYVIREKIGD